MELKLLVSDIDGTFLTSRKVITERTLAALASLKDAGIAFTFVSSRPPRGVMEFTRLLETGLPVGAFNGSARVFADGRVQYDAHLDPDVAHKLEHMLEDHGLSMWVFSEDRWVIKDPKSPYLDMEERALGREPEIVAAFAALGKVPISKVVGVSRDFKAVLRCADTISSTLGDRVECLRSQPYFLDLSPKGYHKGWFLLEMARELNLDVRQVAAIGDADNDIPMFKASGVSIAMGSAEQSIKAMTTHVTGSCDEEGFAHAVETIVLGKPQR